MEVVGHDCEQTRLWSRILRTSGTLGWTCHGLFKKRTSKYTSLYEAPYMDKRPRVRSEKPSVSPIGEHSVERWPIGRHSAYSCPQLHVCWHWHWHRDRYLSDERTRSEMKDLRADFNFFFLSFFSGSPRQARKRNTLSCISSRWRWLHQHEWKKTESWVNNIKRESYLFVVARLLQHCPALGFFDPALDTTFFRCFHNYLLTYIRTHSINQSINQSEALNLGNTYLLLPKPQFYYCSTYPYSSYRSY